MSHHSVPGLDPAQAKEVATALSGRLIATVDLQLDLKHIHWNVVGPNFIGAHKLLDEQTAMARALTDEIAERIATLGGTPDGTSKSIVENRTWENYSIGRAQVATHFKALDEVYDGVINDHRAAMKLAADIDPVTEDLLIGQTAKLELAQWFIRSHIESADG